MWFYCIFLLFLGAFPKAGRWGIKAEHGDAHRCLGTDVWALGTWEARTWGQQRGWAVCVGTVTTGVSHSLPM